VVIGLMLQNSVVRSCPACHVVRAAIPDWRLLDTPAARGRIVEANWRAVHIQTGHGLQITPNSVLAATSFTNMSRPPGAHKLSIATTFSVADSPDRVRRLLIRVATALPQRKSDVAPTATTSGAGEYQVSVALKSLPTTAPRKRRSCGGSGTRHVGRNCTSTVPPTNSRHLRGCRWRCEPSWRGIAVESHR